MERTDRKRGKMEGFFKMISFCDAFYLASTWRSFVYLSAIRGGNFKNHIVLTYEGKDREYCVIRLFQSRYRLWLSELYGELASFDSFHSYWAERLRKNEVKIKEHVYTYYAL